MFNKTNKIIGNILGNKKQCGYKIKTDFKSRNATKQNVSNKKIMNIGGSFMLEKKILLIIKKSDATILEKHKGTDNYGGEVVDFDIKVNEGELRSAIKSTLTRSDYELFGGVVEGRFR